MTVLHYRLGVPSDTAECIELRGRTRENAITAARLASYGITVESWSKSVEEARVKGSAALGIFDDALFHIGKADARNPRG